ncbi:MAG: hypothetical protein ABMB14_29150, partial [Myxococcota bacterium]
MASLSRQPTTSVGPAQGLAAPASEPQSTDQAPAPGSTPRAAAGPAPNAVIPQQPQAIKAGDTLRAIAKRVYQTEFYWDAIRDANPTLVFDTGKVFKVGDVLTAPEKTIPDPAPAEAGSGPAGGTDVAFYPEQKNTDYGSFLVYPDTYRVDALPTGTPIAQMWKADYDAMIARKDKEAADAAKPLAESAVDDVSYGLFDWAVTDGDATRALHQIGDQPLAVVRSAVTQMGADKVARLMDNLPAGEHDSLACGKVAIVRGRDAANGPAITDARLKGWFDALADTEVTGLQTVIGWRFKPFGGMENANWTAEAMRRAWTVLERLPPDAVAGNELLELIARNQGGDGGGYWDGKNSVIGFNDLSTAGVGYGAVRDAAGNVVNPGQNVNFFDTVLRHEIGHAVDSRLKVSETYGKTAVNAGQWQTYANADAFAQAVIDTGGGTASYANPDAYGQAIKKAVKDGTSFNDALAALKTAGTVPNDVAAADAATTGPVAAVFVTDRWKADKNPWYSAGARPAPAGRVFQESYGGGGSFCSYLEAARVTNGMSAYQWRAPGEWFAEAYAYYYTDHPDLNGKPVGTTLRARDPQTAGYLDTNVDKGFSPTVMRPTPG